MCQALATTAQTMTRLPPNFLSSRSVPLQTDPQNIKLLFYYFYDFFSFYSRYITCKNCTIFSPGSLWVIFIHRWQCILNILYYVRACFSRSYQLSHDLYKKKYLAQSKAHRFNSGPSLSSCVILGKSLNHTNLFFSQCKMEMFIPGSRWGLEYIYLFPRPPRIRI